MPTPTVDAAVASARPKKSSPVTDAIRNRLQDTRDALDRLDSLLDHPEGLPGLLLARAALTVDETASRLAQVANNLAASISSPKGKIHEFSHQ